MSRLGRARDAQGVERWLWSSGGIVRDLSAAGLGDSLAEVATWLADGDAREALVASAPEVASSAWQLLLPGRPGKALCLGRNFAAHAQEMGATPGGELLWFAKLPEVLIGPDEPVRLPAWMDTRVDPEAELVALVGRPLHGASNEEAEAAVVAYTLGNDLTARGIQEGDKKKGWPWLRSKNLPGSGCLGPAWTPAGDLPDFDSIMLRGSVNGVVRQEGRLGDLIWRPGPALAEISRWLPLNPGDIVYLGTPSGVAPVHPGDEMVVEAEGLGRLRNRVERG